MLFARIGLAAVLALSLGACGAATRGRSPAETGTRVSAAHDWWPRLSSGLVGRWTATTASGGSLEVRYRLVSRDTALVQSWAPGTAGETLTVLHPDGDAVLLTHYCGQGNQARLAAVETSDEHITFRRFDVTNAAQDQSVLTQLTMRLSADGTSYEHTETYVDAVGTPDTATLVFRRMPEGESGL